MARPEKGTKEFRENLYAKLVDSIKKPSVFAKEFLDIEMFSYNARYVDDDHRWIIYRAGRKVGKTTSTACKVLHFAWFANLMHELVKDRCDILIVAPTQNQANIMFDQIKTLIHRNPLLEDFIVKEKADEMWITWLDETGITRIYTRAAGERGDSIRGYQPHVIIVDECAFVRHAVLNALIPGGLAQKAKLWLTSTPFGKQGYFYEASMNASADEKHRRWKEYHVPSTANPLVKDDPDFIEELKKITKEEYQQEVLGEFSDSGDALFPRSLLEQAIHDFTVPDGSRFVIGVDVARVGKDETVFVLLAIDKQDNVYVVKTYAEGQSTLVRMVEKVEEWAKLYNIEEIYMDETGLGAGAVDLAMSKGLPVRGVVFSLKSKEEMYNTLRLLFENGRIKMRYIDKMMMQLSYMKRSYIGGHMRVDTERGLHDDYPDALALACKSVASGETWHLLKPIDSIFG